ncbi:hypothetical protein RSK20926_01172 [Roseobacter sp. SK209-2-6]|uniref:glycosyltransferase n=1 Tax=Roseobacter sp. SK209-2-6 TaxID=388739 RepID=UPI0000F3F1BB|nr:glycosyltransferase [Roseobacter sp. SK209-2-6]EBA14563.1 hypothetical protein RSK20926_01172 [Roseobacter sp. SK209-2-6]
MQFTHVIQTRFNLATPGRESAIRNRPDWLEERFEMFERICLPSIAAQTCKNFTWIIYFDKDTPEAQKERVEELRKRVPFIPYYTGLFAAEGWNRSIGEVLPDRTEFLLTTRLDNDDALASDYIERVQQAAQQQVQQAPLCLNFSRGYIRTDKALYEMTHPSNAFFTRLCPWNEDMRTAMSIQHMTIKDHGAVVQLEAPGAWLQVVHGGNVSNKVRGRRIPADNMDAPFAPGLLDGIPAVSAIQLLLENISLAALRNLRDWLLSLRGRGKVS